MYVDDKTLKFNITNSHPQIKLYKATEIKILYKAERFIYQVN